MHKLGSRSVYILATARRSASTWRGATSRTVRESSGGITTWGRRICRAGRRSTSASRKAARVARGAQQRSREGPCLIVYTRELRWLSGGPLWQAGRSINPAGYRVCVAVYRGTVERRSDGPRKEARG